MPSLMNKLGCEPKQTCHPWTLHFIQGERLQESAMYFKFVTKLREQKLTFITGIITQYRKVVMGVGLIGIINHTLYFTGSPWLQY